ncbi:MAG: hypothetical protein H6819_10510 [Phycisphaerales bacterium]|nr:hypothetical protein [Phycisphaerales bacterium]MCB9855940.1 hypothetical protein [Phycisphaerales bacterium]MCB9864079.1 hypothetical protein [Phycisphaerales bacterium]
MKPRIAFVLAALAVVSTLSAFAGSIAWSENPVIETSGEAGYWDQPIRYETRVWKDGSAELKLTPMTELPEEMLPAYGSIRVNDTEYKMAVRKDSEGRQCLYGCLPVGTLTLNETIVYTATAYDYRDKRIFNDYASNVVE